MATVTWLYAAAFGIPVIPVAVFVQREGRLPSLWGLFEIYAGPWTTGSDRSARGCSCSPTSVCVW